MRPVGELVKRKMNGEKDISRASDEYPRTGAFLQVVKLVAHAHGKCVHIIVDFRETQLRHSYTPVKVSLQGCLTATVKYAYKKLKIERW